MKDSRVSVWTNPTSHSTGSTTNTGPVIDLYGSGVPVGGTSDGTNRVFGIGIEILQTQVSGTAQSTDWTYEICDTSGGTYISAGYIGTLAMSTDDQSTKRLKGTIITRKRFVKLVATNTGTGSSTSKAYAEDMGGLAGQAPANG